MASNNISNGVGSAETFKTAFSDIVDKADLTYQDYLRIFAAAHHHIQVMGFNSMSCDMINILRSKDK